METACQVLGGEKGRLYLIMPSSSIVTIYDETGNAEQRRPSNLALRVIEACALINNTGKPLATGGWILRVYARAHARVNDLCI